MASRLPAIIEAAELIELRNPQTVSGGDDSIRRWQVTPETSGSIRLSAEVRVAGVTGVPGVDCAVFFNLEYADGTIFWDTFLYPDTGSTPWRRLSTDVRARPGLRAVEMHVRFRRRGQLQVRDVRVEPLACWPEDADLVVAVFGDSTDMTCYLPTEHRLTRRLELLLRDRFGDHRIDVHGLAEGGEYLQRLLQCGRFERELGALPRCDIVLLRYGLNDRSKKIEPADFGRQMHQACDTIEALRPEARIVLSTTIPPHADAYDAETAAVAKARGLALIRLDQYIRERSAAGDCDWHNGPGAAIGRRRDVNSPADPTGLAGDLHPNLYGAEMIAECYFETLHPIAVECLKHAPGPEPCQPPGTTEQD